MAQMQVLVADDDPTDRQMIKKSVSEDVHIVEATSASEVLDLVKQTDFDCIVLDHRLPDTDSISLIPQIRKIEIKAPTPVIVVTGLGDEMLAVATIKAGASDYIPKDKISNKVLGKALKEAVEVHKVNEIKKRGIDTLKRITCNARDLATRYDD